MFKGTLRLHIWLEGVAAGVGGEEKRDEDSRV